MTLISTNTIGKPVSRVDGPAKVTGQAKYAAEFNVPGLAHGFVVSSTIAKGRIKKIDRSAAIAVPGVLVGAPCACAAARLVRAQLYGIAPGDPRTLLIAAATSLATVLAASWLPALRASRVAPVAALRDE